MISAELKGRHLETPKNVPTIGLIIFSSTTDNTPYIKKKLISIYRYPSYTAFSVSVAPILPNDAVMAFGRIDVKPKRPLVIIW